MKQLVQQLRDGKMEVKDVAMPGCPDGFVLVQNYYSLISAGTEGSTVVAARKSLVGKAKERPDQVKQVISTLKQQGIRQTYRAVSKKLDSYSSLGYSCSGVVIDVGAGVRDISVGDKVACAGAGYAVHAEFVSVPQNLCTRLGKTAQLANASYNTLGAIAMQGVRQAGVQIGESCAVIGLGLLGQLTCLMLKASGIKVIGLDVDDAAVKTALDRCADFAYNTSDDLPLDAINRATGGIGCDAVIITAATRSLAPINQAGQILRKRGTVVVVGDVPTGFNRNPDYYQKELSLKMSCSYGPGRYDPDYEEKGQDYPAGYVRWTENRNMAAFQHLVHSGTIDIDYMTTHEFAIDDALQAYDLIVNRSESFLGILIRYDSEKPHTSHPVNVVGDRAVRGIASQGIGFIGAGSYAMSYLLPNIPKDDSIQLTGVVTSSGNSSRSVAEKFGFQYAAASAQDIFGDEKTNTVFITTRHDSHAKYVIGGLQAGKNIFVEKPLCVSQSELDQISEVWNAESTNLMVGYNRRFSPFAERVKDLVADRPVSIIYRVNAGSIPKESWVQDPEFGGGRIIGEVCHFIDFIIFVTGSLPSLVYATKMASPHGLRDTVSISIDFDNGSIGTICYFANGSKAVPKEHIEVFCDGSTAQITDFRELQISGGSNKRLRKKLLSQDKGQRHMIREYLARTRDGGPALIRPNEIIASSLVTFAAERSLDLRESVQIDWPSDQ